MSSTPEAPLRFDCPACGAVLTVPATIAGMQGPCPKCWQEIISPDPSIGAPARLPAPPPAAAPAPKPEPEPEPELPPAPEPLPVATTPAPEPEPTPVAPPPAEPVPAPAPAPVAAAPIPEPVPAPAPPPEPAPVARAVVPPGFPEPPPLSDFGAAPSAPPLGGETKLSEDEMADLTSIPTRRPRSKALLVLGIGLPLLALAAVGYHFTKDRKPVVLESPKLGGPPSPAPAPSPDTAPAPTPDETGQGLRPPPTPAATDAENAQEALVAFLGAPDWQARSAFVLSPDEVRPAMEKHAKANGDGPIPASSIHWNEIQSVSPVFVFQVCTKAMPEGFPVPVILTDEGPKIDWDSFTAFNDDLFHKLLTGPPGKTAVFNLLVKPETGAEPSPHWFRYRLSAPMPGREATGWVRKDSVTLAQLKSVFEGSNGYDKENVDDLVSRGGVPLQLAVMKRRTNDGQEFIEVVELVGVKWGPPKH